MSPSIKMRINENFKFLSNLDKVCEFVFCNLLKVFMKPKKKKNPPNNNLKINNKLFKRFYKD